MEDVHGYIWVVTNQANQRFDPEKEIFEPFRDEEWAGFIRRTGLEAWLKPPVWQINGRLGDGLFVEKDLVSSRPVSVLERSNGEIWIASKEGIQVSVTESNKTSKFPPHGSTLDTNLFKDIFLLVEEPGGQIWFTNQREAFRLDPDRHSLIRFPYQITELNVHEEFFRNAIHVDREGKVWIGTIKDGLWIFDPVSENFYSYKHNPADPTTIAHNHVFSILEDDNGRMWLGTRRGLSVWDPLLPAFEGLDSKEWSPLVHELLEIGGHNLLLGSFGRGLTHVGLSTGEKKRFHDQERGAQYLPSNYVLNLHRNAGGEILFWLCYPVWEVWTYDESNESVYPYPKKNLPFALPALLKEAPFQDSRGRLYFLPFPAGMTGIAGEDLPGMVLYDPASGAHQQFQHGPDDPQSLSTNEIVQIYEASDGQIWIGTHWGLNRFDPVSGKFTRFMEDDGQAGSISENNISDILEDRQGNLWVGHGQIGKGGLDMIPFSAIQKDSIYFLQFHSANSALLSNHITSMATDGRGRLWVTTDPRGGYLFDENSRNFKSFPAIASPIRKGASGKFYVKADENLSWFYPDSLGANTVPPPVFFSEMHLFNQPVPIAGTFGDTAEWPSPLEKSILLTSSIRLPYHQNDVGFSLATLNYTNPGDTRFRYKLKGQDKALRELEAGHNFINYTNLDPGKYLLEVWGINEDGVESTEPARLEITIVPPWWATWWAYTLYVLATAAMLSAIYRFQLRRRLEQVETARLKELDEVKTRLYINITHEFRTPLTIILGMVDQLKAQASEHAKEGLQLVKRNGRQLLRLVNQMLDLSKLESGRLQLDLEQGDMINYLQYLMESFHSYAESKKIRLHFMNDLKVKEFYMDYDPVRLMHVVSNLLSNAIKFTPEGGDVYLTVDGGTVDGGRQDGRRWTADGGAVASKLVSASLNEHPLLIIRVKDTGIGIPEEKLPYVFDRFYQVSPSPPQSPQRGEVARGSGQQNSSSLGGGWEGAGEGTGIGLALAKGLVKLMGGRISVHSELGAGSEFTVALPVNRQKPVKPTAPEILIPAVDPAPAKPVLPRAEKKEGKPLMLIVEDNSDLARYLVNSFNPAYNLEVAYNGRQGIDKAVSLIPDIIITDVMMPEKDGFELCDHLKRHNLTSHIPIIMLTARVDADSRLAGLRRGADAYLEKPFLQEELETRIKALLLQRQRLQAYYLSKAGLAEEAYRDSLPSREEAELENDFLAGVNAIMEKHIDDPQFTVEQLSRELFIDSSNLYRKLKALTGINPNQYIRSFRLAKAKKLLADTNLPIIAVAAECGFADQGYFSRIFKKETGLAPTKYRAQNRI